MQIDTVQVAGGNGTVRSFKILQLTKFYVGG